jgi:hypothetical protein
MTTEDPGTIKPLYRNINADDEDPEVMEIESYCVNCEENVRILCSKYI